MHARGWLAASNCAAARCSAQLVAPRRPRSAPASPHLHPSHKPATLQYEGGEPCKVCGHVLAASTAGRPETVMPTTVVAGFLYLGSYDTASRQELLKAMQITDILNVRWRLPRRGAGRRVRGC